MKIITEVLVMLCWAGTLTSGANILAFFPFPGVSHHRVFWPLLRELAVRGHNVTMVSPFSMVNPPANYKEVKVPDYSHECRTLEEESFIKESNPLTKLWKNANLLMLREMGQFHTEKILQDPAVQWLVASDSKFEIIIGEFSFAEEAFAALTHRFQASYIELGSFGNFHWSYWLYGNPLDTSYIVDGMMEYTDKMNFIGRFHNTVFSLTHRLIWYSYFLPKQQVLADTYIRYPGWETRPSIVEALSKTSLLLMNTHYTLNYAYPLAPHVKEVGGLNMQGQEGTLPKAIKEFIDGSNHGVIYFSMGSYIIGSSTFDDTVRDHFIHVFSKLKQRVLWKWEKDIPNLPSNIMISKWMPQTTILAHPKCLLFITHCGFLSLSETIDKAVPVIAIPVFADQHRNAKLVSHKGLGVSLEFANLTQASISWSLNEVISNPSYRDRIVEQSKLFKDKPETALGTAVYWTEYVIRHKGAPHLRPAIASMPWYQQAMLDVYSAMAAIVLIPLYIIYKTLRCFCRLLCGSTRKKPAKKQKTK